MYELVGIPNGGHAIGHPREIIEYQEIQQVWSNTVFTTFNTITNVVYCQQVQNRLLNTSVSSQGP